WAVETDFEVRISKASVFKANRKRCDFAVPRHDRPDAANGPAKVHPFPTGARFGLHEMASTPFPWRQREFFHNRLSRIRECEITIARVEINAAEANPNRIHSIQFGRGGRSHHIRETRRASHAQDGSETGF